MLTITLASTKPTTVSKTKDEQKKYTTGPRHDKTNKMSVRPAKTQISLGIRPVWSDSSLSAWRKLWSLATHWAHRENSDQTGRMPRLIWVFVGRKDILLVLSYRGSITIHNYDGTRQSRRFGSISGDALNGWTTTLTSPYFKSQLSGLGSIVQV